LRIQFDAAAFSPDGRTLWTGTEKGKFQTWDTATGKLLEEPATCPPALRAALRYSPDGKIRLDWGGLRLVTTGRSISGPIELYGNSIWASSPDGKLFALASHYGVVRVYCFPQAVEGSPERLKCWVEVITGMELDADGAAHMLGPDAWKKRKQRLEELGGPPIP
jgi:WD40 repeat protein